MEKRGYGQKILNTTIDNNSCCQSPTSPPNMQRTRVSRCEWTTLVYTSLIDRIQRQGDFYKFLPIFLAHSCFPPVLLQPYCNLIATNFNDCCNMKGAIIVVISVYYDRFLPFTFALFAFSDST